MRIERQILTCVFLLFVVWVPCTAQTPPHATKKALRPYTNDLPRIDKVELLKLRVAEYGSGGILATKTLTGQEAQKVASLWRRQTYRNILIDCHNPAFGLRFYSGEKLLVHANICWDCDNISFETPEFISTLYFEGRRKVGQQLLGVFRVAFFEPTNYRDRH
jgi:hypothetical protein